MRVNFGEFRQNLTKLCDISKEMKSTQVNATIVLILSQFHADARNFAWHFVRNFVWGSEISGNISCRAAKFRVTFRLAEQNFVRHFVWRREISCNISFGGVEFVAKVLDFIVS